MKHKAINIFSSKEDGLNTDIYFIITDTGSIWHRNRIMQSISGKSTERQKEYAKRHYKEHGSYYKEYLKKYYKRDTYKLYLSKRHSLRRGWEKPKPINNWFPNSHLHHLHVDDHCACIYIPKNLHINIRHSYRNKKSMDKINKAAFKWLCTTNVL